MNNNYDMMQQFLNKIRDFAYYNPEKEITHNLVYSTLMGFNVTDEMGAYESVFDNFSRWQREYKTNQNIRVKFIPEREHFLWFMNGNIKGNEIKLYIPIDKQHLDEGQRRIFNFISSTNIEHQSKIADKIRNDNLVIRVNSLQEAETIVNFVKNDPYIQEGLMKVNPFLPNCDGIGMAMDNNSSYNSTIAKLVQEYVNLLKSKNRLDLVTVAGFNEYVKSVSETKEDLDEKDICNLIYKVTSKDFKFNDFLDHVNNKLLDHYDSKRNRIVNPEHYFEFAIIKTYEKHPNNPSTAILSYLKGESKYFTNDDRARERLLKYVQPRDIIPLMRNKLSQNYIQIPNTDKELIEKYLKIILYKEKEYDEEFEVIKKAYIDTVGKYDEKQGYVAMRELIQNDEINYFTNQYNGRDNLEKVLEKLKEKNISILSVILHNIDINNLNQNNMAEIINRFVDMINIYNRKTKINPI